MISRTLLFSLLDFGDGTHAARVVIPLLLAVFTRVSAVVGAVCFERVELQADTAPAPPCCRHVVSSSVSLGSCPVHVHSSRSLPCRHVFVFVAFFNTSCRRWPPSCAQSPQSIAIHHALYLPCFRGSIFLFLSL